LPRTRVFDGDFLTVGDVAGFLKWTPKAVYRYLAAGWLPGYKFGPGRGSWRVDSKELEAWCRQRPNAASRGEVAG